MSYFTYNGYQHPNNEVNLERFEILNQFSPRGKRMETVYRMHLMGELQETGAALLAKIDQLISAYANDYGDAGLYLDDGTLTAHYLNNSDSVTGVRVVHRSWDKGDAAELATKRTFSITLQAIEPDVESQLLSWTETLRFVGTGGPDWEWVKTSLGLIRQVNFPVTPQWIIQSGEAYGYDAYVEPPGSLFPGFEHTNMRPFSLTSGQNRGREATNYKTEWSYIHSTNTPTAAAPTTR